MGRAEVPARNTPEFVETVLALHAQHQSGAKVAAELGCNPSRVYKILHHHEAEFEHYRREVRMRCVERAWAPMVRATQKLSHLIDHCDDLDKVLKATDKLFRIIAYASGISADNNAIHAAARKPLEMTQTTNVLDANAIAEGIRAARQSMDSADPAPGNGNRIHPLRG